MVYEDETHDHFNSKVGSNWKYTKRKHLKFMIPLLVDSVIPLEHGAIEINTPNCNKAKDGTTEL